MMRMVGPALRAGLDPFWSKVVLLMQGGTLADQSPLARGVSTNGSVAAGSTGWTYNGKPSVKLTASSSASAIRFASAPTMGTQDWTLEMAMRVDGNTSQYNVYPFFDASGGNGAGITFRSPASSGGGMSYALNGAGHVSTGAAMAFTNFELYLCIERKGRFLYLSRDGVVTSGTDLGSTSVSIAAPAVTPGFGSPPSTAGTFTAYLAQVRHTLGVARYNGQSFTPPTGLFPVG